MVREQDMRWRDDQSQTVKSVKILRWPYDQYWAL